MYTRQHVCVLANIDVERFKTLARRNQLPTVFVPPMGVNERSLDRMQTPGWNRFPTLDAAKITVSEAFNQQMGYADGLSSTTAAMIASNNSEGILEALQKWADSPAPSSKDIWVGYAGFYERGGGENVFGTLETVSKRLSEYSTRAFASEWPARLFLVNVSEVIREMARRAAAAGIQFPGEDIS
jgi:hypothetical protein